MKDEFIPAIIFLTAILSFLVGYITYSSLNECPDCVCIPPTYNISCPEPICPKPICNPCPECKKPNFQIIAEDLVKERQYDRNRYNCLNYAQELARRLRDYGYDVKVCIGKVGWSQDYHAWVKIENIYIEATAGKVLTPLEYQKFGYEEDYCV